MKDRPKIKVELSQLDRRVESAGIILLVVMWALTAFIMIDMPGTIPVHFNASGNPDSYGNKLTLLFLPALGTVVYFGLSFLNRYPHVFNYMTKITIDNAARQYTIATKALRVLKLSIIAVFIMILVFTYLAATGIRQGIGNWFLPLILVIFLVPLFISVTKSLRAK